MIISGEGILFWKGQKGVIWGTENVLYFYVGSDQSYKKTLSCILRFEHFTKKKS